MPEKIVSDSVGETEQIEQFLKKKFSYWVTFFKRTLIPFMLEDSG